MTSSRRRAAGFAESVDRHRLTGDDQRLAADSKTYSTGNTGGFSGRPMSAGSSTRNKPGRAFPAEPVGLARRRAGGQDLGGEADDGPVRGQFDDLGDVVRRILGYRTAVQRTGKRDRTTAV